ncbi:MAG TPA: guanylate kinase [Acholeplasmatales bacterium]|nr:guanylate kinase [Acholeplasmatales bacterium]
MKLDKKGLLVVISGPSGVGKGTIRRALFAMTGHDLVYSVSMTTRKPRCDEENGREYWFVTREEFERNIRDGEMLEYAEFINNYYGTPLQKVNEQLEMGKEVVLEIEVQGAQIVREKRPDAILIFIAPPSMQALYERLQTRGTETWDMINERIKKAEREINLAYMYDYIVVNDTVENAADKIMAIIRAEHARVERTISAYKEMLEVK